jgi:ABC-type multidrug transport system fused ATPase/permease subunit
MVRIATALTSQRVDIQQRICGYQAMMGLGALVYRKSLKLSSRSTKMYTQGKAMNLMHMDSMRVSGSVNQISNGISLVSTLALSMCLLYYFLGVVALIGILICIITIVINYFIANFNRRYQKKVMALKDERIKKTNEVLQSVKILKMYGWCDLFKDIIAEIRMREIMTMQKKSCISGLFISSLYLFPKLMSIATFFLYAAFYGTPSMGVVFATINVFNIMSGPLRTFPWYISALIDAFVSGKRIQEFLVTEDVPQTYKPEEEDPNNENAIEINGCDFTWDDFKDKDEKEKTEDNPKEILKIPNGAEGSDLNSPLLENEEEKEETRGDLVISYETASKASSVVDEGEDRLRLMSKVKGAAGPAYYPEEEKVPNVKTTLLPLKNINVKIKKGEFIFVIGEIGSGKSSLLQAMIGDLNKRSSNGTKERLMQKSGKIAYVEQHPWIQNGTVRNNIVFVSEYNEEKYKATLKLCELEDDIAVFPAGDMTEIGERGINLSGGQKARVSLARAIYSDREIYLLDDPLSALDSNVKGKIFHNCIVGKLAKKTIVLASHCIEFLEKADRILVLDKGEIIFDGSYTEFIKNERFVNLVSKIHLKDKKPAVQRAASKKKVSKALIKKSGEGKIISEEELEQNGVSINVYKRYISALGGAKFVILFSLIMGLWIFTGIASDWWLGLWAQTNSNAFYYLSINAALALVSVVFVVLRVLIIFFYSIRASKKLHQSMLSRIMNAPVNLFFDTTPIGRIINRLSSDLHSSDVELPLTIGNLQMGLWRLIGCIVLCAILIYLCILPIFLVILAFWYYLKQYLQLQRKLKRLARVLRSPIFQFVGESYAGATTIRAYECQNECIQKCHRKMDDSMKCEFYITSFNCWVTLRVQFVSLVMNVVAILFAVSCLR